MSRKQSKVNAKNSVQMLRVQTLSRSTSSDHEEAKRNVMHNGNSVLNTYAANIAYSAHAPNAPNAASSSRTLNAVFAADAPNAPNAANAPNYGFATHTAPNTSSYPIHRVSFKVDSLQLDDAGHAILQYLTYSLNIDSRESSCIRNV